MPEGHWSRLNVWAGAGIDPAPRVTPRMRASSVARGMGVVVVLVLAATPACAQLTAGEAGGYESPAAAGSPGDYWSYSANVFFAVGNVGGSDEPLHAYAAIPGDKVAGGVDVFAVDSALAGATYMWDALGNKYHFSSETVPAGGQVNVSYEYNFTIRFMSWANDTTPLAEVDDGFDEYEVYTSPSTNVESDDPGVVAEAVAVTGGEGTVVGAANAVFLRVRELLDYQVTEESQGASGALSSGVGDCSDFSCLSVAMLRAAGIPARVVLGLPIGENSDGDSSINPPGGDDPGYTFGLAGDNFFAHAWVEYRVPGLGWVPADPTWYSSVEDLTQTDGYHFPMISGGGVLARDDLDLGRVVETNEFSLPVLALTQPGAAMSSTSGVWYTVISSQVTAEPEYVMPYSAVAAVLFSVIVLAALGVIAQSNQSDELVEFTDELGGVVRQVDDALFYPVVEAVDDSLFEPWLGDERVTPPD